MPRLDEFKTWLEAQQAANGGQVLPKSPMGEAITYALNQWKALTVYTTDGDLNIDNNVSERALRRIAVGRNNWQFVGSDNGAPPPPSCSASSPPASDIRSIRLNISVTC